MKDSVYLVFGSMGLRRMVKGKRRGSPQRAPTLNRGEYAVLVTVEVPDAVFKDRPVAQAAISVPERAVIAAPPEVTVSVPEVQSIPDSIPNPES